MVGALVVLVGAVVLGIVIIYCLIRKRKSAVQSKQVSHHASIVCSILCVILQEMHLINVNLEDDIHSCVSLEARSMKRGVL